MATTAYSKVYSSQLRAYCTYTVTETDTDVTVSGTIGLQHKGSAYSSVTPTLAYSAALFYGSSTVKETPEVSSYSKHTSWTTLKSTSFSHTETKTISNYTRSFKIGVGILSGAEIGPGSTSTEFSVSIPAVQTYPVTYNVNGGTGGPSSQTKLYGTNLTLSSVIPTRQNYSFYHWNTAPDNTGTSYAPGASYTANAALSLYAIWNLTISFDANGGTGAPSAQTKTYGTNLTLSSTQPTRAYATFVEWNTKSDGTGTRYLPGGIYSSNEPTTLYAIWRLDSDLPTITSMTAIRWDFTNNVQKEDSTSAKVQVPWYIDTSVTNSATVTLTVVGPTGSTPPTITSISGTSGTSGTAIFRVNGVELTNQYVCTVTVTDQYFSSSRSAYITKAYFIFDFKAGGEAVGFGRIAPASGLEVGYDTVFDGDVTVLGTLTTSEGGGGLTYLQNNTTASTTVEKSLVNVTSITLPAGTWLIMSYAYCFNMGTAGTFRTYISSTSGSYTEVSTHLNAYMGMQPYETESLAAMGVVTLGSSTTLYLLSQAPSANCIIVSGAGIEAIKIG